MRLTDAPMQHSLCRYAILDFLAKPVFTLLLFVMHVHLDRHHESLDEPPPRTAKAGAPAATSRASGGGPVASA